MCSSFLVLKLDVAARYYYLLVVAPTATISLLTSAFVFIHSTYTSRSTLLRAAEGAGTQLHNYSTNIKKMVKVFNIFAIIAVLAVAFSSVDADRSLRSDRVADKLRSKQEWNIQQNVLMPISKFLVTKGFLLFYVQLTCTRRYVCIHVYIKRRGALLFVFYVGIINIYLTY